MAGSLWLCGFGTSEVICDVARRWACRYYAGIASALPELAPGSERLAGTAPVRRRQPRNYQ
jgi:hypothetical protein